MSGLNLSALAVRERAITLFLLVALTAGGIFAFLKLGRAEDPPYTIKALTVTAVWPGATAQQMQDLIADPLEKRLQELQWYDRVETFTRPGIVLMVLNLRDQTPPREVPDQFYQPRKNLGDDPHHLPLAALGPFVNDEYSNVDFAVYAIEATAWPRDCSSDRPKPCESASCTCPASRKSRSRASDPSVSSSTSPIRSWPILPP